MATPLLMGVVNVTPDSFSDGGRFVQRDLAVAHALQLLEEGADWIDVGGESTRPGAAEVDAATESQRVVPVIEELMRQRPDAVVSVDTQKLEVARAAIDAGATVVNDVSGLRDAQMRTLCARTGVTVVVMHMRGRPATMQRDTHYADVASEVRGLLLERAQAAQDAGIAADRIVLDPGLGFGKAVAHNPRLVQDVPRLKEAGYRVLVGASRKSFIGAMTGRTEPTERVAGSVGVALAAALAGADVLRVHDVAATRDALILFEACRPRAAGP
ncbi:MAG: dihydropteroate synthase [Myxococcales bacterium]|nr:dihydropteroate synthase [Myxococcales bacterium]